MSIFSKKQKNKGPEKTWERKGPRMFAGTPKRSAPKKKNKFSRFLFWFLLAAFFGICVYLVFFSPFLDVENISIQGNRETASQEIADKAEKALEGKYFGFLSKKNIFLASKNDISNELRNDFGRLEVVSIEKKFPKTILITVTERKAELAWCSAGVCYLIDGSGLAYGGATGSEENMRNNSFLAVIDDSARPFDIGKTRVDTAFIAYLETANNMLENDLKLDLIGSYHTPGMASQEISVLTGEGWIMKMSSETPPEEAKKIIQTLFDKDLNADARKNLEYLDLSVKGKVYYKMK